MRKLKKKTVFIILAVVVVIAIVSLVTVNAIKSQNTMDISVKTTKIAKQDIQSNILTSGTIKSKQEREVSSDISGKIKEILVEEGETVKKGDVLANLDSEDLEYELKQGEIKLEVAKDRLDKLQKEDKSNLETGYKNAQIKYNDAKKDYQDKKSLFESGVVSKSDLDEAKSTMQTAYNDYDLAKKKYEDADSVSEIKIQEKEVKSMELNINKIKSDIEKANIVSPINGTVIECNVSELSVIESEKLMFKIQNTENLEAVTNVSEYDIGKVKIGQPVKVTCDGAEKKEYKGTVAYISPNAVIEENGQGTETVVEVKVDINDENTKFKPNFSANVEINTANKKGALTIPYEAIYGDKDGTKCIYVVENNKAKKCSIDTGIEDEMIVEVVGNGFKEGDLVILNPTEIIKDGCDVKVNKR